jgi:hypothetical protein
MDANSKGLNTGFHCDRKTMLKYFIHLLDKKIEKNPKGKVKMKGKELSYKNMRREAKVWIKVWF